MHHNLHPTLLRAASLPIRPVSASANLFGDGSFLQRRFPIGATAKGQQGATVLGYRVFRLNVGLQLKHERYRTFNVLLPALGLAWALGALERGLDFLHCGRPFTEKNNVYYRHTADMYSMIWQMEWSVRVSEVRFGALQLRGWLDYTLVPTESDFRHRIHSMQKIIFGCSMLFN